ncbi:hypothetical protein JCM14076_23230 [Methylosoma difficile]
MVSIWWIANANPPYGLAIDADLIAQLVEVFPEATGRDIKGLSKLVAKYCQHKNTLPTLEVFKRCSVFRGMELVG